MNVAISQDPKFTAFNGDDVVGTKVIGVGSFIQLVNQAIKSDEGKTFENGEERYRGTGFITLSSDAFPLVRCGVAAQEGLSLHKKHIKRHDGVDQIFALPSTAAPVTSLKVLVYQIDKYLLDKSVRDRPSECADLLGDGVTHVIVAVHAGPAAFTSHRLVRNIAGDNLAFILKTKLGVTGELEHRPGDMEHDSFLGHNIVGDAKETIEFERRWCVVADPTDYDN